MARYKNESMENLSEDMVAQLDSMSEAIGFNRWMFDQYADFVHGKKIWEIGSGVGNMSGFILDVELACLSEYDDVYRKRLTERYGHLANVKITPIDLNQLDVPFFKGFGFDTIISTNVIEHIEDDYRAIRWITETMKSDTHLITLVPAHPALYGKLDKKIGHFRRYTKNSLKKLLEESGHQIIELKYFNRVSAIGWFIKFKLLGKSDISTDDVKTVEKLLPLLKLEKYFPLPFGQSLIAVSKKA